jgi:hypothetical protein
MSAHAPSEPIAATPARMLPLLVIVPVVVAVIRLGRPHYLETPTTSIGFAVLCAGVLGLPALFWALDHSRTGLRSLVTLGALAGLLAPLGLLVAGVLGQLQCGGLAYLGRTLDHGATVPWYGMLLWPQFAGLMAASAIAGAASAMVYWLLLVHRRPSLAAAFLISIGVVAAAAGVAMLLP